MNSRPRGITMVVEGVRGWVTKRAAVAAALWCATALGVVLLMAWLAAGPGGWRQGSAGPLALDLLALAALASVSVGLYRWVGRALRDQRVAAVMDEAAGLAAGSVLGSLELARKVPVGVSPELALEAERAVVKELRGGPASLAGSMEARTSKWLRAGTGAVIFVIPVLVLLALLSPDRTRFAWGGLSRPISLLAAPVLSPLQVSPGTTDVQRGSPVQVRVEALGRTQVTLRWQSAGDILRSETTETIDGVSTFDFDDIVAPMEYWATVPDGAESERFTLTPVDPLFLADLAAELTFPSYTERLPEAYRGEIPPLRVPLGTRIRLEGRASRNLLEAGLVADELDIQVDLDVQGAGFEGVWAPRRSGVYQWVLTDEDGVRPDAPAAPIEIRLVADSAPSITLPYPGQDTILPLSLRQPLVIEARDDYGVGAVELVAYRVSSFGERGEAVVEPLAVAGTRGVLVRPVLDLTRWGLLPGDTVKYFARAMDNSPREQWAETPTYALRMPSAAELRWGAQEELEDAAARVEELAGQAARAEEETRNLERQAGQEQTSDSQGSRREQGGQSPLDFQEREDLQQALDQQQQLSDQVENLQQELGELSESLRDAGVPDPELRQDLDELQQLLDQALTPEMRERLEELQQALSEMDRQRAEDALEQLGDEQSDFRQRLEESLERFRRAAVEQEFRAASSEVEELAREQEMLADAMREGGDMERRAEQQEGLQDRTESLDQRLEGLDERLAELGEQQARQGSEEAQQQTESAQQSMSQAAQQARQGNQQKAAQNADEAAEALKEAASQLQDAQQQMAQEMQAAVQEALEQAASDALTLARRQSELREEMRRASPETMAEIRGDEAALLQGVKNMTENLSEASRGSQAVDQNLAASMGQAMQSMEETLSAMENQRGPTPSPYAASEGAVDALNQVALQAMANSQQLGEQGEGGGAEQLMQQLEQLAQQQGQVMNETSSLMPMQLGAEAMANQLQQISQGQESVASDLGELAQEPGAEEQTLGDLEAMAEEARQLAELLAGGRMEPETLERQERLFHRLLDAGRSLEKEEFSEERESETAGAVDLRDVPGLTAEALGAIRFELPDAAALQSLPPAQRQMVLDYFERLNRAAAAASQPRRRDGR